MNRIYDFARFKFATAALNWNTTPLFLMAYGGPVDFNAADDALSDITARGVATFIAKSQAVTGANVTPQGYMQTGVVIFEEVPAGPEVTQFVIISQPALEANAVPILHITDAYDLPFTPNGLDIPVTPDWTQQRGWFRL